MEVETQALPDPNFQSTSSSSFLISLRDDVESRERCSYRMYHLALNRDSESSVTVNRRDRSSMPMMDCNNHKIATKSSVTVNQGVKSGESTAALKLQKVYRSYRTRRRLADSAVTAEELWWRALDSARLIHSTISFFDSMKPESAASRWNRISLNASMVGKGLSGDGRAKELAFQHWIEAIDPRHRYGHNLRFYFKEWRKKSSGQPFFYWLDIGDGREVDLKECPRSNLRQQCIKYLGPQEREQYEYVVVDGKILHKQTGELMDTTKGSEGVKWIFVMSSFNRLYAGKKKKGKFHHSSFLAGGATLAAGRLVAVDGMLKSISPHSGHYRPTDENQNILDFLRENGVNIDKVQRRSSTDDYDGYEDGKSNLDGRLAGNSTDRSGLQLEISNKLENECSSEPTELDPAESTCCYRRTLSGGLQSPRTNVPKKAILHRINSKNATTSYQLGHQLSLKWSSGVGPRIGCVADYPQELREQALEFVSLSPRLPTTPSASRSFSGLVLPSPHPTLDICNVDVTSVI